MTVRDSVNEGLNSGKKIIVFGAGDWGRQLLEEQVIRVECFLDNSPQKQGGYIGNIPILPPGSLRDINPDEAVVVIANELHAAEIEQDLLAIWRGEVAVYRPQASLSSAAYFDKLRYNVTYLCNSRCQTCSIWKNQPGYEMSPEELGEQLSSPAFSRVENFFITGGEPTLRKDFPQFIKAAAEKLPCLKWVATVTNALLADRTVALMTECRDICRRHGIQFAVSVSIDGLKEVYDQVRGVPGGFAKAVAVIERLKAAGVKCNVSVTISSLNIWHLEELRAFLQTKQWETVYKCAQFEKFFNSEELVRNIFSYDEDQRHQLLLFLHKMLASDEPYSFDWNVAYNTIAMAEGRKRMLGCGYHETLRLMQDGSFMKCGSSSFASERITPGTAADAHCSLQQSTDFFIHTKCEACLNDTFSYPSEIMKREIEQAEYWKEFLSFDGFEKHSSSLSLPEPHLQKRKGHNLLIVGEWGREDVVSGEGLRTYVNRRTRQEKDLSATVCSEYPFITRRTLRGMPEAEIVPVYDRAFLQRVRLADELVIFHRGGKLNAPSRWAEKLAGDCGIPIRFIAQEEIADELGIGRRPEHEQRTESVICCCIDVEKDEAKEALVCIRDLALRTGYGCRFLSVSNFCLGRFGDNRDIYFELIPQVFGEHWKDQCTVDDRLADLDKLAVSMQASELVVAVGDTPARLANVLGIKTYDIRGGMNG